LDELSLKSIKGTADRNYFENQRNLRKFESIAYDLDFVNFQQLKLEQIKLEKLDRHTLERLKGQDKIV
jgi:hypothetical protein